MAKKVAFSVIINDLTGEVEEIKTSKRLKKKVLYLEWMY